MPRRSTTRWRFVPGLPRFVGSGPVCWPPFLPGHWRCRGTRVPRRSGQLPRDRSITARVNFSLHPAILPVAQPPPAGHARAAAHLLVEFLAGRPGLDHEDYPDLTDRGCRSRPPLGFGGSVGNNGSIVPHSSSGTRGLLMPTRAASPVPWLLPLRSSCGPKSAAGKGVAWPDSSWTPPPSAPVARAPGSTWRREATFGHANLSPRVARFLANQVQRDVTSLQGQRRGELPDHEVIALARRLRRVIITLGRDYSDYFLDAPHRDIGTIYLDLPTRLRNIPAINQVLADFFARHAETIDLEHSLVILREDRLEMSRSSIISAYVFADRPREMKPVSAMSFGKTTSSAPSRPVRPVTGMVSPSQRSSETLLSWPSPR